MEILKLNRQGVVLNAVMLAALSAVIAGMIHRFVPAWQPGYLVAASFLVALEAGLIHHIYRSEHMWVAELLRYLVPELFVMFLLMRVAITLSVGAGALADDARRWLYDPLSIFDLPFCFAILGGLLVGALAHATMADLFELAPRSSDSPAALADTSQSVAVMSSAERVAALRRISGRFIFGGVILLLMLALEAVNIERIAGPSRPVSALSAGGALLYLVSGLLLYSQGRLALIQARWRLEGAQVAPMVSARWTRVSWIIIVGVACVAALLPRTYGLGLLATIQGALGMIGAMIALLGYAITSLLSLLAILPILLLSLLTGRGQEGPPPALPPIDRPPPLPPPNTFQPNLLTALIFWICMFLLAGHAISIVLQRHPGLLRAVTTRGPLAWLLRRLGWLWRDTSVWAGQAARVVVERLRRAAPAPAPRTRALRLSRLAPRELVRYFYRSTLRRAASGGLPRRAGQTPYEYSATLARRLPEAEPDIVELTEAFVAAEYSSHPPDATAANRARRPWERVRRRLRALKEERG